jgi:hypothetical protein
VASQEIPGEVAAPFAISGRLECAAGYPHAVGDGNCAQEHEGKEVAGGVEWQIGATVKKDGSDWVSFCERVLEKVASNE